VSTRLTISLPNRMEYLGVPDAVLMEVGADLECARRSLEELGTAVIEACTNAMEHGNHLADDTVIEVVIEVDEPQVTVTVMDEGPGFDYAGWQPSDELMRQRGRGILIMREFSDSLDFGRGDDGRFFVRLVKTLAPAGDDDES
jgi:serine/threonine-protein kinase RsbW